MPPKKNPRTPFRLVRDLFGATLGATSRQGRRAAMQDWEALTEGEQSFVQAELTYQSVRAQGMLYEKLTFIERWLERADQRAELEDEEELDEDEDKPRRHLHSVRGDDDGDGDGDGDDDGDDDGAARRPLPPLPPKGRVGTAPAVLARSCATCGAQEGEECRTSSGKPCSPHAPRLVDSAPTPTATVEVLDTDGTPV
jgi:hypothetical protein